MSKRGKFMDVLEVLSGSDASGSDTDADGPKAQAPEPGPSSKAQAKDATPDSDKSDEEQEQPGKKTKKLGSLTVADLERAGYKSGPSVLFLKPAQEGGTSDWNWSNGHAAKQQEGEDNEESRQRMREALTTSLQASAEYSAKSVAHAHELREAACVERERLKEEHRLSYNQKEKRKRELGQASRGGSYVEEEKRLGRQLGMYSGFD